MRNAGLLAVAILALCATGAGCTKRVPLEEPRIDARQTMVIVFGDGTEIRGKIGLDEDVQLTTGGAVYRGVVEDVTEQEIELRDCRFVRRTGGVRAAQERMANAVTDLGVENIDSLVLERDDIVSTEQVRVDALKTASRSVFWMVAGAVTGFLLSEKS